MSRKPKSKPLPTRLAFQDDADLMTPGAKRDRLLDQMAKMGAKWVRANVAYSKTQGGTDLSQLDDLVNAAKARGLHVQATLMSDPSYSQQGALNYKNNDPKLWAQFAKAVASHEKGRITRYSIGNEMNYPSFAAGSDTDPRNAGRQYRNVFRQGRLGVKRVDPHAQVLFGELTNMGKKSVTDFMKGALGGKRLYADGLAYHPYDSDRKDTLDSRNLGDLQKLLHGYKRKLQTVKGAQVPLYLTEYGKMANTGDQASRAKLVAQAFGRAQRVGAREFLQYQLSDKTPTPQTTPVTTDSYGNPTGGGQAVPQGWYWDTSLGTKDGDLSTLAKALTTTAARSARAHEAKAKPKAKLKRQAAFIPAR